MVQELLSSPLRWSLSVSVGLRFSFPLLFQGLSAPDQVCWCCVLSFASSLFCFPLLVSRLSNLHSISIFISFSSPCHPHLHFTARALVANPARRGVCVCACVERLNRRKTSFFFYLFELFLGLSKSTMQGMERTYEAPSSEAPHMLLVYHWGRSVTYLQ